MDSRVVVDSGLHMPCALAVVSLCLGVCARFFSLQVQIAVLVKEEMDK